MKLVAPAKSMNQKKHVLNMISIKSIKTKILYTKLSMILLQNIIYQIKTYI